MFERFRKRSVTETATELQKALPDALGDNLVSLIRQFPDHTLSVEPNRLHILIVLNGIDLDLLDKCADAIQSVSGHEAIVPMILSEAELLASTDVFPITFLEMKYRYDVLAGVDMLEGLSISDEHLRLRCEQELKNLLIRMQSAFLLQKHRVDLILESLKASYSTLLRCLRATIRVIGENVPNSDEQVIALAASRCGLDEDVLARAEETCRISPSLGAEAIKEVYGQLLVEVHRIATVVDELEQDDFVELDSVD